jgi:nucleotide-binding universal stress UspA family protein
MYKSILIPIDLAHAEKGKPTIEIAKRLADENTKIRLVTVIEEIPTFVAAQLPTDVIDNAKNEASSALKSLVTASSLKADTVVRSGTARTAILAAAEEWGADLIIVGSHKPGLSDYLLGTTAARVVRHAKCSVLVVR